MQDSLKDGLLWLKINSRVFDIVNESLWLSPMECLIGSRKINMSYSLVEDRMCCVCLCYTNECVMSDVFVTSPCLVRVISQYITSPPPYLSVGVTNVNLPALAFLGSLPPRTSNSTLHPAVLELPQPPEQNPSEKESTPTHLP